jgi:hypothetical protein
MRGSIAARRLLLLFIVAAVAGYSGGGSQQLLQAHCFAVVGTCVDYQWAHVLIINGIQ